MDHLTSFLEESLEAWRDVREGLIAEVENIPGDQFDYRPTPEVMSVRDMVRHILEAAMLMTGELTRPDTNLKRKPFKELMAMYAQPAYDATTKEELVALLKSQLDEGESKFRASGELAQLQFLERFDGKQGTKLQWFHHGIAHEMYHRGQICTYVRMMGLTPALTQLIQAG